MIQLTQSAADALKPPTGSTRSGKPVNQSFLWCPKVSGFGIRCTLSGSKSWVVQGRVHGKERRITIGKHALLSFDSARKKAKVLLQQMSDGVDPVAEEERKAASAVTLSEVAEDYIVHRRTKNGPLRARTISDIRKHINGTLGAWKARSIATITAGDVVTKFKELSKTRTAQANQAMLVFGSLHSWARKANRSLEVDLVGQALKGMWHPSVARTGRIPLDKVGDVWRVLTLRRAVKDRKGTATGAAAVAFQILAGMRWGEVVGMTWDRLDLDGKVPSWHLTADKAKNHNEIRVPLSTQAVELLRALPRVKGSEYVFPQHSNQKKPLGNPQALWRELSTVAGTHLSSHDMRRTMIAIALKCGIELWRAEILTNHRPRSVTLIHYVETNDLREDYAADVQRISDWIEAQAVRGLAG